jgi:CelD/BcsL family acetyltransferase involved in cellulose biosynthesis
VALSGSGRAVCSTAHPATFSTGRLVIAINSAASVIAGARRAASVDRRNAIALEAEWRPLAALADIAAEWRKLAAQALEPNVFYDPTFALPAAAVFGRDVGAVLVWSQTMPRKLLGLFPTRIERTRYGVPMPVLRGWTHPYAPLGAPLVARVGAEAVIAVWLAFLAGSHDLPGLLLLPLVPEGPLNDVLDRVLARTQMPVADFGRHQRALFAPEEDRNGYVERAVRRKKRKELHRLQRRLGEQGAVEMRTATRADVEAALAEFIALEARGWKGRAGSATSLHPDIDAFMREAVTNLAAAGRARIDRLTVDGRAIATAITLMHAGQAWCWKIAYDEAYARYSPGVLLILALTEKLLADPTIVSVDSCATADHSMIDRLWRERLTLADRLVAVRERAPFAAARRLERLRRVAIAAIKSTCSLLRAK